MSSPAINYAYMNSSTNFHQIHSTTFPVSVYTIAVKEEPPKKPSPEPKQETPPPKEKVKEKPLPKEKARETTPKEKPREPTPPPANIEEALKQELEMGNPQVRVTMTMFFFSSWFLPSYRRIYFPQTCVVL